MNLLLSMNIECYLYQICDKEESHTQKYPLFMVAEDVRMSLGEYNEKYPDEAIDVKIGYQLIKKNEECIAFFRRVIGLLG